MELYRRIRLLRLSSRTSGIDDDMSTAASASTRRAASNHPRSQAAYGHKDKDLETGDLLSMDASGAVTADAIDSKYHRLYEEKLDPFKLEELDRVTVLSRLSFLERSLAYGMRVFVQDRWARHALMVYLVLVHIFAFSYVITVLNPQLVEEVDAYTKAEWSKKTLEQNMEAEHPDVRFRW